MNWARILALCVAVVAPNLSWAAATSKVTLSATAWVDLGAGPMGLAPSGNIVFAIGDTTPTIPLGQGFALAPTKFQTLNTTSHVWAMMVNTYQAWVFTTPVNAKTGGGPCAQAVTYLGRTAGGNEGGNAANITTLICGLVSDGVWSKLDVFYVFAQQNQADSFLNLVSASFSLTPGNSAAWVQYYGICPCHNATTPNSSGFTPSTAPSPHYTLNDASYGIWSAGVVISSDSNDPQMGTAVGATLGKSYMQDSNSGSFVGYINGPSPNGIGIPWDLGDGERVVERSSSTTARLYSSGVDPVGPQASSSTAVDTSPFYIGFVATGLTGTYDGISGAHIGSSLGVAGNLALQTRMRTYITAVGGP